MFSLTTNRVLFKKSELQPFTQAKITDKSNETGAPLIKQLISLRKIIIEFCAHVISPLLSTSMVTQFSLKERIAIANGPILKHSNLWSSLHPTPSLHVLSGHISFPFHPAGSFFIYSLKLHICSPALWLCPVTSPTFPKYLSSILIT